MRAMYIERVCCETKEYKAKEREGVVSRRYYGWGRVIWKEKGVRGGAYPSE